MQEFKIGDRVRVKDYDDLPDEVKTRATGGLCGKEGVITDIIFSNAKKTLYYVLHLDGYDSPSGKMFTKQSIELAPERVISYRVDIQVLEKVVAAELVEVCGDDEETVARGHGHILHDGAEGIAQAASYACKKLWFEFLKD